MNWRMVGVAALGLVIAIGLIRAVIVFFGFWAKFGLLTLVYVAIAAGICLAIAAWATARNPQGFRDRMFPQRPQAVGFAPPPQNPTLGQWFAAIAINNDWLFWLPLVACILTGMIATARPAGEPILSTTWREIRETSAWNTAREKTQGSWNFFLYGDRAKATSQAQEEQGDDRDNYGTWFRWLAFLVYLLYLPLGLVLAFHDEVMSGIRRVVDRFTQRRQPLAPPQPPGRRGRQQPPSPAPAEPHVGFLVWEAILDFFSGFAGEYLANRALRRRLI